jgi:hypothetical protein
VNSSGTSGWQDLLTVVQALSAVSVPIVVLLIGDRLNRRLKLFEASQWRNQELIKTRVHYYQAIAPQLNDVMCYFTFIGRWKEVSPTEVIAWKRTMDRDFHTALPLFGDQVAQAYEHFTGSCFEVFGEWGQDARLRTGYGRRRDAFTGKWDASWEKLFTADEVLAVRASYNAVLAALAQEIELLESRDRYASDKVTDQAR